MAKQPIFKQILFDLGGVILNINTHATLEAFLNIGFPAKLLNYPENFQTDLFFRYETGKLTTDEFRDSIRSETGISFTNEVFDSAWLAMIGQVPPQRIQLLKRLSEHYTLYMLSNTSELHMDYFEKRFEQEAGFSLDSIFTKCYYSYQIGEHKPDEKAFQHVLDNAGIRAEETLFLDDNIQNIKAASALGFNAIHITESLRMESVGYGI